MGLESVNYQCPACGGPLRFDSATQHLVCEHCDSSFMPSEVERLYAEKNKRAEDKAEQAAASAGEDAAATAAYVCSSCGAELVNDGTTAVSTCPYCGNPVVATAQLSGEFAPKLVMPFRLDHKAATEALENHYKGKVLMPKSFKAGNHVDEVQGVYVPFWLYNANPAGTATFEATRERRWRQGDDEIVETDHFNCFRRGFMSFERIPVDGSTKMPDGHMDAIEPFDFKELLPFSTVSLPGYVANRWDEDAEACRPRAEKRLRNSVQNELEKTVEGYDTVSCTECEVDPKWSSATYAMLPVWMLHPSWTGQDFLFAMNGQTGQLVGDLPISKPKLAGIAVGMFAVLVGLMMALSGAGLFEDWDPMLVNLVTFGLPVLIDLLVCLALVGQMHTAVEASDATNYLDGKVTIGESSDTFTHTTRQVIHHEKKKD